MDEHMNYYSQEAQGEYNALVKLEAFIDSMQEETVSEDLKKAYEKYVDHQIERIYPDLSPNLPRQSRMTLKVFDGTDIELAFEAGAKWQKEQSKK
jgi:hypothetical protein